ncbi:bifunctional hydroxymethylpyrimidine kinase/phosphomethylpyrimidine kinase, partial [Staphylococcus sp. EG-SA-23]|uniref:bifunctional hydroxymethylpyrimidine kinase/phosphomethylpyrimidine kinase n=1 Tax=Staphylococcus sp. EG-SA-23 TaxID=2767497 RepID=UPI001981FFDE
EEFYKVAQALLINIGTLTAENEQDIIAIAQTANEAGLPIVFDPVMLAKSGDSLMDNDTKQNLQHTLLPLADVVTPNLPEAEE